MQNATSTVVTYQSLNVSTPVVNNTPSAQTATALNVLKVAVNNCTSFVNVTISGLTSNSSCSGFTYGLAPAAGNLTITVAALGFIQASKTITPANCTQFETLITFNLTAYTPIVLQMVAVNGSAINSSLFSSDFNGLTL
jgi:hypothetical protein